MKIHYVSDQQSYTRMTTEELRSAFLVQNLFQTGELHLTLTDVDRAFVDSAVPTGKTLSLPTDKELSVDYFCVRREVGVINIGKSGKVVVDGETYSMGYKDSLYISKGSRSVEFQSEDNRNPAQFYIVSYPAHRKTQTVHVPLANANQVRLGDQEQCNKRVINQSITPGIVDSCQLVMGITELEPGSIWNTKPPHTHRRRTEVYMYCLLYTSPSPRDRTRSRMPSSA